MNPILMQRYGIHGFKESLSNPIDFWGGSVCTAHTAPTRAQLGKRCSEIHLGLPHSDMSVSPQRKWSQNLGIQQIWVYSQCQTNTAHGMELNGAAHPNNICMSESTVGFNTLKMKYLTKKNQRNIVHQIYFFLPLILDMLTLLGHMFWTQNENVSF